jgi:NitT/TauT family transport system ATP-binding protein
MSAIRLAGVGKHYEGKSVLANVTLEVPPMSLTIIVGPSGCGKSTLLNIAAGLDRAYIGTVQIGERTVEGPHRDTAMIFQDHNLFPWLDACGNVAFGLEMRGLPRRKARELARLRLEAVGLGLCINKVPRELSGGMRQRVALVRALALTPKVMFLDEPLASLDFQTRRMMQTYLLAAWQESGATAVMVTHDLHEALCLADRLVLLSGSPGRVKEIIDISQPKPRDLNHPDLVLLYRRMEQHLENEAALTEFTEVERQRFLALH